MRFWYALGTLVFMMSSASAQPHVSRIEVSKIGTYERDSIGPNTTKTTSVGSPNEISNWRFLSTGPAVPKQRGTQFGIEYTIVGMPVGASVPLRFVTLFPQQGLHDPRTGAIVHSSEFVDECPTGQPQLKGYRFNRDWELVPGNWTQQIWYGNRKLAEQSFAVSR
jgi:hypothetical protein